MIKYITKIDKEDGVQVVTDIVSDKMVTDFPIMMKNGRACLVVRGVKRRPKSGTYGEANALTILKRVIER